jgi:hypothetical protein
MSSASCVVILQLSNWDSSNLESSVGTGPGRWILGSNINIFLRTNKLFAQFQSVNSWPQMEGRLMSVVKDHRRDCRLFVSIKPFHGLTHSPRITIHPANDANLKSRAKLGGSFVLAFLKLL